MMKLLILTSWYPNKNNVVSGIFIKEQVLALKRVGVEPIVFFPYDYSINKNKLICQHEDDILVYRANNDNFFIKPLGKFIAIFKNVLMMKKIIDKHKIKLIHAQVVFPAGVSAAIFNSLYKVPFLITEHFSKIGELSRKFYYKWMLKWAYKKAKFVITVSNHLKDELVSLGYKFTSKIVPNTVDVSKFNFEENKIHNPIRILFIGQMDVSEVKGLQYLLPAFAKYIKTNKYNTVLELIGSGVKQTEYKNMSENLGIKEFCVFQGAVDKNLIPKYISNCDFLVSSSKKETFGSVIIEAMACGKPVLATKCGGPEEIIKDFNGYLVEKENVDELVYGIEYMVQNYGKFNQNIIRKYAVETYGYEAVGNKLKEIYSTIMKGK